jgi:hypothetical protein
VPPAPVPDADVVAAIEELLARARSAGPPSSTSATTA